MRTAIARTNPRSKTPVRNQERRLTTTRTSVRIVRMVKSLASRASAFSIVSHADGTVDTMESIAIPIAHHRQRARAFRKGDPDPPGRILRKIYGVAPIAAERPRQQRRPGE